MAEKKKGIGDALLGLFVVREEDPRDAEPAPDASAGPSALTGDPAVDDLIARYASGGATPKSSATATSGAKAVGIAAQTPAQEAATPVLAPQAVPAKDAAAPKPLPEVKLDVESVLRKAGLTAEEQGRVDKALTLLHNLPAETPAEIKRQIVAASLQAFGIPIDQILESALLHLGAFERHVRAGERETAAFAEQSNRRLAELEKEAARIKEVVSETLAHQEGLVYACSRQKMRVMEVLDFFGPEAVERVKKSSVKLRNLLEQASD